jgi:hypothetical protein
MPNGKIGDHPLTDITIHGRRVYSEQADALVQEIVDLGGRDEISDMLFRDFHDFGNPDVPKLERVLTKIRDRLRDRTWNS